MVDAGKAEELDTIGLIRKRPGMYIGDVHDGTGLHHMLWEAVANSLDEPIGEGLVAVVHAGLYDPQFDSPTRSLLKSPEARAAVAHVVGGGLAVYLAQHPSLCEALFSRLSQ